jgi:hypothetical protein
MKAITVSALAAMLAMVGARAQDEEIPALPAPATVPAPAAPEDQAPAQAAPSTGEQPSAELIIDAEETVANEPAAPGADEPLPQLEGQLPGEENIFGDDLFGPGEFYSPSMPEIPSAPPIVEDPREAERQLRVKFRRLKARLDADAELLSLKEMAERAPTPEDHRAARRAFYALFFKKVRKADNSLNDYADKLEKQSVAGLYQTRIEPTVALNPPPEPQPASQFIPPNEFPDSLPLSEEPVALP